LKPGLAGAWFYEADAHVRPNVFDGGVETSPFSKRGVTIREQCEFHDFTRLNNRVTAVNYYYWLDRVRRRGDGDRSVHSIDAGSTRLQNFQFSPGKGYSMTMKHPTKCPVIPIIFSRA